MGPSPPPAAAPQHWQQPVAPSPVGSGGGSGTAGGSFAAAEWLSQSSGRALIDGPLSGALRVQADARPRPAIRLKLAQRRLTDDSCAGLLSQLPDAVAGCVAAGVTASWSFSIELQCNQLGVGGCSALCDALRRVRDEQGIVADSIALFSNQLGDAAAEVLAKRLLLPQARWCRDAGVPALPREMYLPHNDLTERGVRHLALAARELHNAACIVAGPRGPPPPPLLLRVERNGVDRPEELLAELGAGGGECAWLRVPFFAYQRDPRGGDDPPGSASTLEWKVTWAKGTCWRTVPDWESRLIGEGCFVRAGASGVVAREVDGYVVDDDTGFLLPISAPDGTRLLRIRESARRRGGADGGSPARHGAALSGGSPAPSSGRAAAAEAGGDGGASPVSERREAADVAAAALLAAPTVAAVARRCGGGGQLGARVPLRLQSTDAAALSALLRGGDCRGAAEATARFDSLLAARGGCVAVGTLRVRAPAGSVFADGGHSPTGGRRRASLDRLEATALRFGIPTEDIRCSTPMVFDAARRFTGGEWRPPHAADPCPWPVPDGGRFDGLKADWCAYAGGCGRRLFVNPPFSRVDEWMEKAARENARGCEILALVPSWGQWAASTPAKTLREMHPTDFVKDARFINPGTLEPVALNVYLIWFRPPAHPDSLLLPSPAPPRSPPGAAAGAARRPGHTDEDSDDDEATARPGECDFEFPFLCCVAVATPGDAADPRGGAPAAAEAAGAGDFAERLVAEHHRSAAAAAAGAQPPRPLSSCCWDLWGLTLRAAVAA